MVVAPPLPLGGEGGEAESSGCREQPCGEQPRVQRPADRRDKTEVREPELNRRVRVRAHAWFISQNWGERESAEWNLEREQTHMSQTTGVRV